MRYLLDAKLILFLNPHVHKIFRESLPKGIFYKFQVNNVKSYLNQMMP